MEIEIVKLASSSVIQPLGTGALSSTKLVSFVKQSSFQMIPRHFSYYSTCILLCSSQSWFLHQYFHLHHFIQPICWPLFSFLTDLGWQHLRVEKGQQLQVQRRWLGQQHVQVQKGGWVPKSGRFIKGLRFSFTFSFRMIFSFRCRFSHHSSFSCVECISELLIEQISILNLAHPMSPKITLEPKLNNSPIVVLGSKL